MRSKQALEQFILDTSEEHGHFQQANPDLLQGAALDEFIDAGFGLLGVYQQTNDTDISEPVIGALVSCAAMLSMLSEDPSLTDAERERADHTCTALEDLINALTKAIESNM